MQIEIPLSSNTAEQDVSGSDLLVNVFPRKTIGGKYPFNLVNTPGLAFFCELPTKPVIGLHTNENRVFAVTPSKMYEVFPNGSFKELGDVNLSGRVSMEDNGYQVVAVDGKKGFYFDDNTGLVSEITNKSFYPAATVTYQDGYFLFDRKGTGQFFISELLNVDFDPLDFATAEGQPDNLVAILSDHREIFLFGTESIEVWYNSGASDFPFERNQGAFVEKGCAARYTVSKQNNTVYFVGSDLMVYQMSGYTPIRISTHAVEKTIRSSDLEYAFAYTYQEDGHLFYVLTLTSLDLTWCFDISTGVWHKRESYTQGRHKSNNAIYANSKTLVGDFESGLIYQMTTDFYTDNNNPLVREFVLPTLNNGREFLTVNSLEFDMGTGVGLLHGQGDDPELRVFFSKDSGKTYSENFKVGKIGKAGQFSVRAKVNRFGASRQFTFKVVISDPIPIDIGGAWVEVN